MKITLIVSFFFPPYNCIASKRWGYMTKYLREYGYDPYVICSDQHGTLPVGIEESHIFRIGGAEKDLSRYMSFGRKLIGKVVAISPFYLRSLNRESLFWYWLVRDNIGEIEKRIPRPKIIIGSYGPVSDIYIAGYLSKRWGVPWIADLRDYISDWDGHEEKLHFKGADTAVEKGLLESASGLTVISKGIYDICRKRYPLKEICLAYNGWEEEVENSKDNTESELPYKMYLYYAGNIYDHQYKCIELIVKAYTAAVCNNMTPLPLVIRKAQDNKTWKRSEKLVKKYDLEGYIHFLPGTTSAVCRNEALNSNGNVVFGKLNSGRNRKLIDIPAKTFELMSMKRAIILIDRSDSELAGLVKDTDSGVVADSSEKLMNTLLEGGGEKYSWKDIYYYSRKKQSEILCRFIDKRLESVPSRQQKRRNKKNR